MSIDIKLTGYEMMIAAQSGILRQIENTQRQRKAAYGSGSQNDWQLHIEGCLGEMALSKFLGVYYTGKGKFRAPDVGIVDVRTRSRHSYDLILHPKDPDDRIFYLVTGVNGSYKIQGWIMGEDGKQKEYWSDPAGGRPAFFVPQSKLNAPQ